MKLEELRGKKLLILGYGTEGKATEQYLKAMIPDTEIGIADQSINKDYLSMQKDYDLAIKTPGIKKSLVTIPYTTATNIFFANVKGTTIGVTGSKGKSTTASLIHHILKSAGKKSHLAGNIGQPLLAELLTSNNPEDIFVCELSSYQTEDLQYSPHISVITSIFPEHMDYHGSVEQYYSSKKNLLSHAKAEDYFIYNPKYKLLKEWAKDFVGTSIDAAGSYPLQNSQLIGEHNAENAHLASSVGELYKIDKTVVESAIQTFKPLAHRLEYIGTFKNIKFYDDAISTAPEATIAAIKTLSPVGTLFLGGEDRGYDFNELVDLILKNGISNLVLFPTSGEKIEMLLREKSPSINILKTSSMKEAVEFAYKNTPSGSICLLSTASPSYSLWKNFEEKGNEFQKWVNELS